MGRRRAVQVGAIYCAGDTVACLISGQLLAVRMLGVFLLGTTVYAIEIHNYFALVRARVPAPKTSRARWSRAMLAVAWFNPLWIARHQFFLKGFSGSLGVPGTNLIVLGSVSFLVNLPVALVVNYLIQNAVAAPRRVYASAAYSAATAVFYALMEIWFQ